MIQVSRWHCVTSAVTSPLTSDLWPLLCSSFQPTPPTCRRLSASRGSSPARTTAASRSAGSVTGTTTVWTTATSSQSFAVSGPSLSPLVTQQLHRDRKTKTWLTHSFGSLVSKFLVIEPSRLWLYVRSPSEGVGRLSWNVRFFCVFWQAELYAWHSVKKIIINESYGWAQFAKDTWHILTASTKSSSLCNIHISERAWLTASLY